MSVTSSTRANFVVVTDSTADIAPEIAAAHGVTVVPLSVTIGGGTFPDGQLSQAEFFARMNALPTLPTTSQPPIGSFIAAYERALESADEVISVHISNRLSGTVESARQAAERFAGRVHVFDSLNLSWGLGWQVIEAARAASDGMSVACALELLGEVRGKTKLIVGLDGLENLAKGGRIGRVGAFLGSLLNLKVTLTVGPDGAFEPLARSRGEKAAMKHTLEWIAEQMHGAEHSKIAVGHALGLERAEWLRSVLAERYTAAEILVYEAGSVICTHTGTGWGVAILPQE